MVLARAEQLSQLRVVYNYKFSVALRDPAGHFAADRRQLALEVPYARLARMLPNDLADCFRRDGDHGFGQSVVFDLLRDQKRFGDLYFFVFGVTRKRDHFHPVPQGRGDRIKQIGCR